MKKFFLVVGVLFLALILIGGWFVFWHLDHTYLIVSNATRETIPLVTVESDAGEKWLMKNVTAGESRSLTLPRRDASIRLAVLKRSGLVVVSDFIYTSGGIKVRGTILDAGITLSGAIFMDKVIWEYVK